MSSDHEIISSAYSERIVDRRPAGEIPSNRHLFRTEHFFPQNFMKVPYIFFLAVNSLKRGLDVGMVIFGLG